MQIKNIKRINYIKSYTIEGYKGFFSEWGIQIESGAAYGFILDFCNKYLSEEKFTKEQFIEGLKYFAEKIKNINYHPQMIITSFYELFYDKKKRYMNL